MNRQAQAPGISAVTRRAWLVVGLLWVVALLNYLDRLMITTMRDPIKAAIPMTDAQFGLLTSVFLWVYGLLSPFGGFLADRFSRSKVILGSLFVWSLLTWVTGYVKTFEHLLLARALMGISEACYIPAALALICDYHRGSTRSLATGLHMSGVYAGAALGGVGGYLAKYYGWRAGFGIFGAFGVAYAILLAFYLRDVPRLDTASQESSTTSAKPLGIPAILLGLFGVFSFWILFALNALVGSANWSINGWLPTYLKEHFHLGLGAAGLSATGYIQTASFLGVLLGGAWADKWSRTNPRARTLVPAIGYCIAGPCLFLSAVTDTLPMAIAGLVVFGLGRGFFDANHMPILRQLVNERYSATGYGLLNLVSCVAGGIMIYASGRMKDAHVDLSLIFQISAAGLFVVGLLLLAIKPRPARIAETREDSCPQVEARRS
ncbi:MFS transporter [Pedosphaera parvula]|uniref:Major facilitator superfamily MFS_1 n=1 Tax=Pedosphaera parvula (strain Ellin514) TaxID=320771 RepID=B9XD08_PEDPL|nr:MFS transporter [Pedosphaera parvula]EEF62354.1 major facilitator superfamily MFS_1 [Pedosphaera parvula Ellin514]